MRAPNMKYHIIFGLVLAIFGIVPLAVLIIKYTSVEPISSLPLDYWLWLGADAAGWLLIIVMLRFFPNSIADAFVRISRSSTVWIFCAVIFAASAVEGIFSGSFLTSAPAIVIASIGSVALATAGFQHRPKG